MNLAVFDIDGTLTRPYPGEDPAFLHGLESALGLRGVDPDWTRYPHVTDTGIVDHVCRERWKRPPTAEEMSAFQRDYSAAFIARALPGHGSEVPGAAAFVAGLRSAPDWCVALATGNFHALAILKLERGGVPCLDLPMATSDDGHSRAHLVRLAVERARERHGLDVFDHVVSIGDAPWDLTTARELGMPFVAIGERCGTAAEGARMLTDYADRREALRALAEAVGW